VISSIDDVLKAAANAGLAASVCGEMAGSPFYVPLLIGLGARELSMNPYSLTHVRHLVAGISAAEAASLVERVRVGRTSDEVEAKLREYYLEHWSHLFPPGHLTNRHR
jgi:phosphoenolpyruvate-protein kinase (PTS system EI component)